MEQATDSGSIVLGHQAFSLHVGHHVSRPATRGRATGVCTCVLHQGVGLSALLSNAGAWAVPYLRSLVWIAPCCIVSLGKVTAPLLLIEVLKPLIRDMPTDRWALRARSSAHLCGRNLFFRFLSFFFLSFLLSFCPFFPSSFFAVFLLSGHVLQAWLMAHWTCSRPVLPSLAIGISLLLQCRTPRCLAPHSKPILWMDEILHTQETLE